MPAKYEMSRKKRGDYLKQIRKDIRDCKLGIPQQFVVELDKKQPDNPKVSDDISSLFENFSNRPESAAVIDRMILVLLQQDPNSRINIENIIHAGENDARKIILEEELSTQEL